MCSSMQILLNLDGFLIVQLIEHNKTRLRRETFLGAGCKQASCNANTFLRTHNISPHHVLATCCLSTLALSLSLQTYKYQKATAEEALLPAAPATKMYFKTAKLLRKARTGSRRQHVVVVVFVYQTAHFRLPRFCIHRVVNVSPFNYRCRRWHKSVNKRTKIAPHCHAAFTTRGVGYDSMSHRVVKELACTRTRRCTALYTYLICVTGASICVKKERCESWQRKARQPTRQNEANRV